MNKFAKGSLAAGAGLVLLLGGAGTLAYWNSEVTMDGGAINAGTLSLVEDNEELDVKGPELLVPGDQKPFTANMVLTADGENLQGTVKLHPDTVVLLEKLDDTYDVDVTFGDADDTADGFTVVDANADYPYDSATFSGPGDYKFPVTVTVTLPFGTEVDNTSQGVKLSLDTVKLTAEQTAAGN